MLQERGRLLYLDRDDEGVIEVYEDATLRSLYFGNAHRQSSRSLFQPDTLALNYTRCMLTGLLFNPAPCNILMIGLGGGSLATFLHRQFPDCHITVVEKRTKVLRVARRFFSLPDDDRIAVHIGDGVDFAQHDDNSYDLAIVDAFDPDGIHPGVCTPTFFNAIHERLATPGVLAMNLWTTRSIPYKQTLKAIESAFGSHLLKLPLGTHSNLIGLALKGIPQPVSFRELREPARELRKQLAIDFPGYLRTLQRQNSNLFSRLFRR